MKEKTKWLLENLEEVLCAFILGIMALLAFANVITRYFIQYSLAFTEEIEVNLMVWLTLLGTSVGFKKGAHLGLTFLLNRLSYPLKKLLSLASACLSLILFALLIGFSVSQIFAEIELEITSEALELPQWWYTMGIPVCGLVLIFRIITILNKNIKEP
ncbi:MAG TPA: TRAP transporter small permease [Nitrospinota bacterium]|nr:TRAP transporter small permease [Nitrospinota bacterium]